MEIEDGHARYQRYLEILSETMPSVDREVIGVILDDPDRIMAEAVLAQYVDRIGSSYPDFAAWSVEISPLFVNREFLIRRISEWHIYRELSQGNLTNLTQLVDASNWLQRKVVEGTGIAVVLELLAKDGRTKAVRNIAKSRIK